MTSHAQDPQNPELQESTGKRLSFPPGQDQELHNNTELRSPSPPAQVPELQDIMGKRPPSPPAQNQELKDTTGESPPSPPAQNNEPQGTMGKMPPSPPSTEQPKLLPCTDGETPQPLPSTQQPVYVTAKDSLSSGFYISEQKVQNIDKNTCRQMFQALEPFRKEVLVDEPSKDSVTAVPKCFRSHENINTRNH
jgi:hypothetical protein